MNCPICKKPLVCASCAGAKGGKAKVRKGFAVVGQPDAAARKRAWAKRRESQPHRAEGGR